MKREAEKASIARGGLLDDLRQKQKEMHWFLRAAVEEAELSVFEILSAVK